MGIHCGYLKGTCQGQADAVRLWTWVVKAHRDGEDPFAIAVPRQPVSPAGLGWRRSHLLSPQVAASTHLGTRHARGTFCCLQRCKQKRDLQPCFSSPSCKSCWGTPRSIVRLCRYPRNSVGGDGDKQPVLLSPLLWKQRLKETPLERSRR